MALRRRDCQFDRENSTSLLDRFQVIEIEKPDRTHLRNVVGSIARLLHVIMVITSRRPAIHEDVVDILSAGGNTPRSIRQTLGLAFVHAASHGRRQVIVADLVAIAAMNTKIDKPRMGSGCGDKRKTTAADDLDLSP